jgi:hypothetical protein
LKHVSPINETHFAITGKNENTRGSGIKDYKNLSLDLQGISSCRGAYIIYGSIKWGGFSMSNKIKNSAKDPINRMLQTIFEELLYDMVKIPFKISRGLLNVTKHYN